MQEKKVVLPSQYRTDSLDGIANLRPIAQSPQSASGASPASANNVQQATSAQSPQPALGGIPASGNSAQRPTSGAQSDKGGR